MPRRALIIGGSIGGLFAANLLRTIGWDVTVFERSAGDLASRGAGINTSPELFALQQRLGIYRAEAPGLPIAQSLCLADDGRIVHRTSEGGVRIVQIWSNCYRPLRDLLPDACYRAGMTCASVATSAEGATITFTDGSHASGDLVVAADGVQSTVRQQLLPQLGPEYAGYVLWRCVVPETEIPRETHQQLADAFTFALPPAEMLHCVLVPGANDDLRPGHRNFLIIWYRPAPLSALPDLFTDQSGHRHGMAIPPPLIRPELVRDMKAAARATLAPQLADIVERSAQPILQAITDLASPQIVFGRVALLGDAAFAARPHVAAGVSKAGIDAQCLVDALADAGNDVEAALASYERNRLRVGHAVVARGRELGAYLSAQTMPGHALAGEQREPAAVMADYGRSNLGGVSLL